MTHKVRQRWGLGLVREARINSVGLMTKILKSILPVVALVVGIHTAFSDTFGTSGNGFTIDFVNAGNAGNAANNTFFPGYGAVAYAYRIGKYEIPQ